MSGATTPETDFAQDTRKLAKPGPNGSPPHLQTLSCAYREKRGEKGIRRELVNASFVVVPSNVDCVVVESKSHEFVVETDMPAKKPTPLDVAKSGKDAVKTFVALAQKDLQAMTPGQRTQAIHDMSNELGAQCQSYNGSPLVDGKASGTSLVEKWTPTKEELEKCTPSIILGDDGKYVLQVKDADGKTVVTQEFSQATEATLPEADHADQAEDKEKAMALAKARFGVFTADSLEEG